MPPTLSQRTSAATGPARDQPWKKPRWGRCLWLQEVVEFEQTGANVANAAMMSTMSSASAILSRLARGPSYDFDDYDDYHFPSSAPFLPAEDQGAPSVDPPPLGVPLKSCLKRASPTRVAKRAVQWNMCSNSTLLVSPYPKDRLTDWFYNEDDFLAFEADANKPKPKKKPAWATGGKRRRRSSTGGNNQNARTSLVTPEEANSASGEEDASNAFLLSYDDEAENAPLQQQYAALDECQPVSKRHCLPVVPPPPPTMPPIEPPPTTRPPPTNNPLAAAAAAYAAAATGLSKRRGLSQRAGDPPYALPPPPPPTDPPPPPPVEQRAARPSLSTRTRRESRMLSEIETLGIEELKQKIRQVATTRRERLGISQPIA